MLKPHRVLIDKVSSYTDEAAAFVRRRRHNRRSFIRIQFQSGDALEVGPGTVEAERIGAAADALIDLS
ncbi:MAG: hypothetical protein JJE13_02780 [Thermoleophilia bacterium]|nr:hypothetical protein [Thermoleophilia bacterium]